MISRRRVLSGLAAGLDRGAYLRQLFASGPEVVIPSGLHLLDLASAGDCLRPQPGAKVVFDPGAVIRFRNSGPLYVPAVAIVNSPGVSIHGARFQWIGDLRMGPDFPQPDPSFTPLVKRLGSAYPNYGWFYCAAICVLESADVSIRGLAGHSLRREPSGAIHAWVMASRTDRLVVEDVRGDDCCLVVGTQGGEGGAFRRIRGGRMCQDIGIPGHVLYTYLHGCTIEDIEDEGIETGRKRRIGHTVSAAAGAIRIRGIRSKRATGPLNVKYARDGGDISDVDWSCFGMTPREARVDKLYLVSGTENRGLRLSNISLRTDLDDANLIGGEAQGSVMSGLYLERNDARPPKYGFLGLRGHDLAMSGRIVAKGRRGRLLAPFEGPISAELDIQAQGPIDASPLASPGGLIRGHLRHG